MNDTRGKLRGLLTTYQRTTQGMPDIIDEALASAPQFRPARAPQTGSFVPSESAAQKASKGFRAAAEQAFDYPALADVAGGVLGMVDPESYRQGDPSKLGAFAAGQERFRRATPALNPWRREVEGSTSAALQAGVPLAGILGAGMLMGGIGPEDAVIGGAKGLRGALKFADEPADLLRVGKNADEAIGAARAAAREAVEESATPPSPLAAQAAEDATKRRFRDFSRREFEEAVGRVDSGMAPPKTDRAVPRVRLMEREAAFQAAQEGKHLVPSPRGGYVGAPEWVKGPKDLAPLRERLDNYARLGAQWLDPETREIVRGYDWYTRGRASLEAMFPGQPQQQMDFAVTLGIFSEGRAPHGNLQLGLRAWNRNALGAEPSVAGLPEAGSESQVRRFSRYMSGDFQTNSLGNKTLPYAQQLDPQQRVPMHVSANDQIIGRVYDYTPPMKKGVRAELFDRGLTDSEHAFVDAEQLLAVNRANATKLAGRDDWEVGEIQASQWVARRAEDLLNQGKVETLEEGLAQSADDFRAFFGREQVLLPNESTPGVPGVAEGYKNRPFDQRQRDLSDSMRPGIAPGWRDPQTGADITAQDLGLAQGGLTQRGLAGFWQGGEGLEMNPMEAAPVLAEFVPGPHGRQLAPYFREALEEAVTLRAYVDAQAAGAAVAFIPMLKSTSTGAAGNAQNALSVSMGRSLTEPEMAQVSQLAQRFGWGVTSHNAGFYMFPISDVAPDGKALGDMLPQIQGALSVALKNQPNVKVTRGRVESVYQGLPWRGQEVNAAGEVTHTPSLEGSGATTQRLRDLMERSEASRFRMEKLDSPELRAKARAQMRFMRRQMEAGQHVRSDYLNALAILSERGLRGLFDAASKGSVALPALLLVWANQDMQSIMAKALGQAEEEEGA